MKRIWHEKRKGKSEKGKRKMKKRFKTAILSCLVCIGALVYSTLPVRAVGPGSCTHEFLADSVEPIPTGVCFYSESGHDVEYGRWYACLKCGYEYYTNTYFQLEDHDFNNVVPTIAFNPDGTTEMRYYCNFDGCPYYYVYE